MQIWSLSNLFNLPKVFVCLQMHQYSKWSWLKNPSMMQNIILEQLSLDWEWMIRLHVKVFALSLNAFENIWWIPISEFNQNRAKLRFFFDPAFLLQSITIFNLRKPYPQRKYDFSSLKKFHHIRKNQPLLLPWKKRFKTFLRSAKSSTRLDQVLWEGGGATFVNLNCLLYHPTPFCVESKIY